MSLSVYECVVCEEMKDRKSIDICGFILRRKTIHHLKTVCVCVHIPMVRCMYVFSYIIIC